MTSDDARDRVGEMRDGLRRTMRHLSKPGPDWSAARVELLCVSAAARELSKECCLRAMDGRVAFGLGYYLQQTSDSLTEILTAFGLMGQEDSEVGDGNSDR